MSVRGTHAHARKQASRQAGFEEGRVREADRQTSGRQLGRLTNFSEY